MNKAEERMQNPEQPNVWKFVFGMIGAVALAALVLWAFLYNNPEPENRPYALKQNGDTLFIPTQVVVKHDTLVVIRTEERRPVADSLNSLTLVSVGGTVSWVTDGGYEITRPYIFPTKEYKQRDTIYEHKIIYY